MSLFHSSKGMSATDHMHVYDIQTHIQHVFSDTKQMQEKEQWTRMALQI